MIKKELKATIKQYFEYYKGLKLGVNKASLFMKDLDLELAVLSTNKESELFYFNHETNIKYYFDDTQEMKIKLDLILKKLMLKYFVLRSDLIYLEEYDSSYSRMLYMVDKSFIFDLPQNFNLNEVLTLKTSDLDIKKVIIYKMMILTFFDLKSSIVNYNDFINQVDYNIIDFCFLSAESEDSKILFLKKLIDLEQTFESLNILFKQIFNIEFKTSDLQNHIIKSLISWHLKFFKLSDLNVSLGKIKIKKAQSLIKFVSDTLFWFDDYFKLENEKMITTLNFMEFKDDIINLKFPSISKPLGKSFLCSIDYSIFILKFLEPLNSCRIKINLKYLDKIFKLNLEIFSSMCKRYRAYDNLAKVSVFACDFLGKNKIQKILLHERLTIHVFAIQDLLNKIFYKKILLQEKIFRTLVMGSFSKFYLSENSFFCKKDNWMVVKVDK